MKKAYVVINETHKLMEEQNAILQQYDEIEFIKVPASGWNLDQMKEKAEEIHFLASGAEVTQHPESGKVVRVGLPADGEMNNAVVFVSPIPYLMKELSVRSVVANEVGDIRTLYDVRVFHNDRREKKELPNGKIIMTVASTGWQLV